MQNSERLAQTLTTSIFNFAHGPCTIRSKLPVLQREKNELDMLVLKCDALAAKDESKRATCDKLTGVANKLAGFVQGYASSVTQAQIISGDDEEEVENLIKKLEKENEECDHHLKGCRACIAENSKTKAN